MYGLQSAARYSDVAGGVARAPRSPERACPDHRASSRRSDIGPGGSIALFQVGVALLPEDDGVATEFGAALRHGQR